MDHVDAAQRSDPARWQQAQDAASDAAPSSRFLGDAFRVFMKVLLSVLAIGTVLSLVVPLVARVISTFG